MSAGVPMGFVLVVGFAVVLLAALQILILAYLVDAAKGVRRMADVITAEPQPLQILKVTATESAELAEELRKLAHSGDA